MGKPLDSFKTLHEKRLYRKLMQILNDPTCVNLMIFWFDRESIIPGNFGFAISVCRLRERGRMSKTVHVRVS